MSPVDELAEALSHDPAADYTLVPTPVMAEWLAQNIGESGLLPTVYKAGRRTSKHGRVFSRMTAASALRLRWVVSTEIEDKYRITPAGHKALERHRDITRRIEQVGAS